MPDPIDRSAQHLRTFEEALVNLKAAAGGAPSKLQQLEIDAVEAKIEDLRHDVQMHEPYQATPAPDRSPKGA